MRPFRFGVQLYRADDAAQWRDAVKEAADLGYSSVVLADHLGGQFAPLIALAAVAHEVPSMRLGTLVLNSALRHPVVLGKEATTLDVLTGGGRIELGVGAGWLDTDVTRSGLPDLDARARLRRLAEYVEILDAYWRGEHIDYTGEFYDLEGVVCMPRPVAPEPTLLIGGGSKGVVGLAGRRATIAGLDVPHHSGVFSRESYLAGASIEAFEERARWAREAASDAGRDVELQMLVLRDLVLLADDAEGVRRLTDKWNASLERLRACPAGFVGPVDEVCERLIGWRARTGVSYYVVQDAGAKDAAPVVERLAGR